MGISNIIVVGKADYDREEMQQRSTHLAADVLDQIQYFEFIEEALGGFNYIVGTTARLGKARGPFIAPRTVARDIADISQKNKVALLFGPEDTGLANEELRLCNAVVTIPTSREATSAAATPKLARSSELEGMYGQIKKLLADIEFLNPENPDYWMMHLRRFFGRSSLLSREVKIIRGICRQLAWYAHHKKT
jgi:tRNA/rRNA methyltransferase